MKRRAPGREQVVGRLGPQAIGRLEVTIEVAHVERARQRGQLVDDRLRLRFGDRPCHLLRIERVGNDRLRSKRTHQLRLFGTAGHPHHLVTARRQARQQLPSHRTTAPATKTFMTAPFVGSTRGDETGTPTVTATPSQGRLIGNAPG